MPQPLTSLPTWAKALAVATVLAAAGWLFLSGKQAAPEVTFTNLKGEKIESKALRGKMLMVNFWATSCATCVKEMPEMAAIYNSYKSKGLEFVAVAMRYDQPNFVLNFAESRKLPFHVAIDVTGELSKAFGDVTLTPTTFVIDKEGNIVKRYVGAPDFAELRKLLDKQLTG